MGPLYMLDPTAQGEPAQLPALGGDGFRGRRVALLTNQWSSWDTVIEMFASDLPNRFQAASSRRWECEISRPAAEEALDGIAATSDVALVGLAN